nr:sensory neuron membrane protein 1 [Matsumurasca onukii]
MISQEKMEAMRAKVQDKVKATPPGTWGKVGAGVLVGGLAIGWLVFPFLLDKVVAMQINLAEGKDSRRLWIQLPTLNCNLYVFNITNPGEVMRGARPAVQEVGPYCYREVKDKTNLVEDPATDTISYSARSTWYEAQDREGCPAPHLTGNEVLTVPNIPLMAVLLLGEQDFPAPLLSAVNQALPSIFGRLDDVFIRVTARALLFDGIPINCTARALLPRTVCIALKQNSRALKKLGPNRYSFSFFGVKNHTPEEFRYTVKRGTFNGQEVGRLVALDGKAELPFWRGECNKLQGTDSSVFPPFRQKENGSLAAYSSEVCRTILGIYEGEFDYKGVNGYRYSAVFSNTDENPEDRCFCKADDKCRKKGVLDAMQCQGAPIVASLPHFYLASQDYVTGVTGLSPDKEKHGISIVLEPISGTPLVVRKRLQFNIDLKPIRYIPVTQRLRRTLVPLFWAEESLDLDGDLMGLLEASLFRPIRAVDVIKWLCIVSGAGLGVAAAYLKFKKRRKDKVHVLNGEAGKDPGYTPQKQTIVLQEIDTNQNYDPSFINSLNTAESTPQRELSATQLLKTATTMNNSENKNMYMNQKVLTEEFLKKEVTDIQTLSQNLSKLENDSRSNNNHLGQSSRETMSPTPSTNIQQPNQEQRPNSGTNHLRSVHTMYNSSPLKSLELEMSSQEHSKREITNDVINTTNTNDVLSFENKNINTNSSNVDNAIKSNNPFQNTLPDYPSVDEAKLFGEPSLESPENTLALNKYTEDSQVIDTFNSKRRNSTTSHDSTTSFQELPLSEVEDINRIIAEISSLLPRRNNSLDPPST